MVTEMEFDTEFWLAENLSEDTDSVVPAWSASLADKYADRTFYVKDMNHMGLVENPDIQEFVNRIIGGNVSVSGLDDIKEDLVMRE